MKEEILQIISEESLPLSFNEIHQKVEIARNTLIKILDELEQEGKIDTLSVIKKDDNNSERVNKYYFVEKDVTLEDVSNMHIYIAKEAVESKENIEILNEKYEELNSKIKDIYSNFIGIVGVFISIFSLITINVNFISEGYNGNVWKWIILVGVINLVTIISILCMLKILKMFLNNK